MNIAAVDIGSNTFRLLVAQLDDNKLKTLDKRLVTVKLGRKLKKNGTISEKTTAKAIETLASFREIIKRFNPKKCRACATEALRTAQNKTNFINLAEKTLGISIETISGEKEANLCLKGVMAGMKKLSQEPLILADVGGGSTEIIFTNDGKEYQTGSSSEQPLSFSLPIGAISLTEKFLVNDIPSKREIKDMTFYIQQFLQQPLQSLDLSNKNAPQLVGSGGTVTTMAAMDLGLTVYEESKVHGHHLSTAAIDTLWNRLASLTLHEKEAIPALQDGRAEIILAGIKVYQVLMDLLGSDRLLVSDWGLLEGMLLSLTDRKTLSQLK